MTSSRLEFVRSFSTRSTPSVDRVDDAYVALSATVECLQRRLVGRAAVRRYGGVDARELDDDSALEYAGFEGRCPARRGLGSGRHDRS